MKAKVRILGLGNRMSGVSKKGNEYDFVPVAIGFSADGYNGMYCETVNVNTSQLPDRPLAVGQDRDVYMHRQNFRLIIDDFV